MRKLLVVSGMLLLPFASFAQDLSLRFSSSQLKQDLSFLQDQLFSVHADPFTEISRDQYSILFQKAERSIKDSMTLLDFYKLVKPLISNLSDEHAQISLPKGLEDLEDQAVFLPFTLTRSGNAYVIDTVLTAGTGLKKGEVVTSVNDSRVEDLIAGCAAYSTGYPDQRAAGALTMFGYLYSLGHPFSSEYKVTINKQSRTIKGISYAGWLPYLKALHGASGDCGSLLSYKKIGETGYINACSFGARGDSAFKAYGMTADSLFNLAKKDGVKNVIIDVSKNSGGNSALGNFLVKQFYTGDCLTYQMRWRRSEAYLNTITGWGLKNPDYEKLKPGEILPYGPDTSWIEGVKDPYKGKVYIMIGKGTFSSAIMFATIIKDNKIAQLIGQEPGDGHPTHFGELYGVNLPNTKLAVRFGVKEWIRPLGKTAGNRLLPDIEMPSGIGIEEIAQKLEKN